MEIIKDIAAVVGAILSIITLASICSKTGRAFVAGLFKRNTKSLHEENAQQSQDIKEMKETLNLMLEKFDALQEVSMQQCRNTIKNVYYKYCTTKRIPLYERKTVDKTYKIYRDVLNGNSYASLLYKEICKWEIEPPESQDLIDE